MSVSRRLRKKTLLSPLLEFPFCVRSESKFYVQQQADFWLTGTQWINLNQFTVASFFLALRFTNSCHHVIHYRFGPQSTLHLSRGECQIWDLTLLDLPSIDQVSSHDDWCCKLEIMNFSIVKPWQASSEILEVPNSTPFQVYRNSQVFYISRPTVKEGEFREFNTVNRIFTCWNVSICNSTRLPLCWLFRCFAIGQVRCNKPLSPKTCSWGESRGSFGQGGASRAKKWSHS